MQLSDIRSQIVSQTDWFGVPSEKIAEAILRLDSDDKQLVLTLNKELLNESQRLAIEEKVSSELESRLQKNIGVIFKKSKVIKPPPSKPRTSAFGLQVDRRPIPGVKNVICVASGKGGVGKSTVSVNLAMSLRNLGFDVGLLDADLYGPSIPKMLGCEGILPEVINGEMWPVEAHGLRFMSFASLSAGDAPLIWRGPMVGKALTQFFYQVAWDELDFLIVDLPPGTGDVQLTLIEKLPLAGAVVVSSPQDLALIDAAKAVQMFRKLNIPILGLVENMAYFVCDNCGKEHAILGRDGASEYARKEGLPLLAQIPLRMEYRVAGDKGVPVTLDQNSPESEVFDRASRALAKNFMDA